MSSKQRLIIIVSALSFVALYILSMNHQSETDKRQSTTTYSGEAIGLSQLHQAMSSQSPDHSLRLEVPILKIDDLNGIETLAILSPLRPPSDREQDQITTFVEKGGRVLLGFHDEVTFTNLLSLADRLSIDWDYVSDSTFENQKTRKIVMEHDRFLFKKGETYHFYSALQFSHEDCQGPSMDCYVRISENQRVVAFAGLPPFSNGLMGLGDNRHFTNRLVGWAGQLVFDEYHHNFYKMGFTDLLKLPLFFLPLTLMLLTALCFFLFGTSTRDVELAALRVPVPSRSYHELNARVLESQLQKEKIGNDSVPFAKGVIESMHDLKDGELNGIPNEPENLPQLVMAHRKIMMIKGVIKGE